MRERVFLALGSNLPSPVGEPRDTLTVAIDAIAHLPGVTLVRSSSLRTTAPVSPIEQPDFVNGACEIALSESRLSRPDAPRTLLADLLAIERRFGRDRAREPRWGPRTLDIDLILFGDRVLDLPAADSLPALTLPHPRLREREFVLAPLAEIAPDVRVPPDGARIADLLERCVRRAGVGT
ncbi:MAG: 2-amino-4-hydroxy-6-hydroxymethyldihydropteridine diphosphokinase [Phycisphaerales bacterium]|nr:2-amino-4-hydroxy-6-hydroxymethyldihydropteridine diphosphokinase [Phycisphaerales bacterium]